MNDQNTTARLILLMCGIARKLAYYTSIGRLSPIGLEVDLGKDPKPGDTITFKFTVRLVDSKPIIALNKVYRRYT